MIVVRKLVNIIIRIELDYQYEVLIKNNHKKCQMFALKCHLIDTIDNQ